MPKGKRPVLSVEQQRAIKGLTFHAAQDAFHIGFQTWKAIREADGFLPFRSVRLMGSNAEVQDKLGQVVSSHGPDDAPEHHEVPFALVMERRAKANFEGDLREPPDQGATSLSRPAPNVVLAK